MVQDKYDVVILDVATVIPLDDELREKFKSKFAAQFGKRSSCASMSMPGCLAART